MRKTPKDVERTGWYYLLGVVLPAGLVVAAVSVLLVKVSDQIQRERTELRGMALTAGIHDAIVLLQELRGLEEMGASVPAGKAHSFERLIGQAIDSPSAERFGVQGDLREAASTAARLVRDGGTFQDFTTVIADLQDTILTVADRAGLVTDPSRASYYLMDLVVKGIPDLVEALGRLRGSASALFSQSELSPDDVRLVIRRIAIVEYNLAQVRAIRGLESLGQDFYRSLDRIDRSVAVFLESANRLIDGAARKMSPPAFFGHGTRAIRETLAIAEEARRHFRQRVQQRITQHNRLRIGTGATALVALILMAWFAVGFYRRNKAAFAQLVSREWQLRREVAQHTRTEAALRESEARWRALVTHAPDVILTVDRNFRVTFINRVAGNRRVGDVLGTDVLEHVGPMYRPLVRHSLEQVFRTGTPAAYEIQADEEHPKAWYSTRVGPVWHDHEVVAATLITRDVTARREAEKRVHQGAVKLARKTRHLRQVNEELEQFAYAVSHDLKAPLRAVSALSSVIEEELMPTASGEAHHALRLLRDRVTRMHRLIEALLLYARAGRSGRPEDPLDLNAVVRGLVQATDVPEGFIVDVANDLPSVSTDRVGLEQALSNLLVNAIRHHDRADGRVTISGRRVEGGVELIVADDGPGIDIRFQDKIFEVFQTLDVGSDGTGIGLALVKKVIESRGGRVWVNSEPGQGAAFHIFLPSGGDMEEDASADLEEDGLRGSTGA